jgi:hypothetical protein
VPADLRLDVFTSEVKVGAAPGRAVVVEALQKQTQGHAGGPHEVLELRPCPRAAPPSRKGSPKGAFLSVNARRDVEAHLVDEAVIAPGPERRRGPTHFPAVTDHAQRQPSGGRHHDDPPRLPDHRGAEPHRLLGRLVDPLHM